MEINPEFFREISIRGRLAYGILCLRETINHTRVNLNDDQEALILLFTKLTSYVKENFLEHLEVSFRELNPTSILDKHPENVFSSYECYSEKELKSFEKLYTTWPGYFNEIVDSLIEIVLCNLYTQIEKNYGLCSLEELNYIFKIMKTQEISLPEIPNYILESKFHQKKGRGFPITLPPRIL